MAKDLAMINLDLYFIIFKVWFLISTFQNIVFSNMLRQKLNDYCTYCIFAIVKLIASPKALSFRKTIETGETHASLNFLLMAN